MGDRGWDPSARARGPSVGAHQGGHGVAVTSTGASTGRKKAQSSRAGQPQPEKGSHGTVLGPLDVSRNWFSDDEGLPVSCRWRLGREQAREKGELCGPRGTVVTGTGLCSSPCHSHTVRASSLLENNPIPAFGAAAGLRVHHPAKTAAPSAAHQELMPFFPFFSDFVQKEGRTSGSFFCQRAREHEEPWRARGPHEEHHAASTTRQF